jgi:hypothetical protein
MIDRRGFVIGTATTTAAATLPALPVSAGTPIEGCGIDGDLMLELDLAEASIARAKQSLILADRSHSATVRNAFLFDVRCKVQHARNCMEWSQNLAISQSAETSSGKSDVPLGRRRVALWLPAAKALLDGGISYGDTVDILWPDLEDEARRDKLDLLRRCERAGWAV